MISAGKVGATSGDSTSLDTSGIIRDLEGVMHWIKVPPVKSKHEVSTRLSTSDGESVLGDGV